MKVKTSVKKRCKFCQVIRRRSKSGVLRVYVYCKNNRRHNQRQG